MTPSSILDFWFGELTPTQHQPTPAQMKLWFQGGEDVDATIRARFGQTLEDAAQGRLESWKQTDEGFAALIILLDQFPRNIFRGTARAFAYDPQALALAKEAVQLGHIHTVHPLVTTFMLLPLEHSEALEDQHQCVALMTELANSVHNNAKGAYKGFLDYAVQHLEIIEEFGRFPHRNTLLDRPSTAAEIDFLKSKDVHFGQKSKN